MSRASPRMHLKRQHFESNQAPLAGVIRPLMQMALLFRFMAESLLAACTTRPKFAARRRGSGNDAGGPMRHTAPLVLNLDQTT